VDGGEQQNDVRLLWVHPTETTKASERGTHEKQYDRNHEERNNHEREREREQTQRISIPELLSPAVWESVEAADYNRT
jgi:hypothetical protein